MRDVKSQLGIYSAVQRPFAYRALDIDDEITGGSFFAGNGVTAEADDIRGAVFTEKLAIVSRDAGIVRQQQGDFLPAGVRVSGLKRGGEFSGQPADCRQVQPVFPLSIPCGCFHL